MATSIVWGMMGNSQKKGVTIILNGKELKLDVSHLSKMTGLLIPVRGVMEGLGAVVGWNAKDRVVTVDKEDISIKLTIGKRCCSSNKGRCKGRKSLN